MICMLSVMVAGFMGLFLVFVIEFIKKARQEEQQRERPGPGGVGGDLDRPVALQVAPLQHREQRRGRGGEKHQAGGRMDRADRAVAEHDQRDAAERHRRTPPGQGRHPVTGEPPRHEGRQNGCGGDDQACRARGDVDLAEVQRQVVRRDADHPQPEEAGGIGPSREPARPEEHQEGDERRRRDQVPSQGQVGGTQPGQRHLDRRERGGPKHHQQAEDRERTHR